MGCLIGIGWTRRISNFWICLRVLSVLSCVDISAALGCETNQRQTNRETELFAKFNTASASAAKWLKTHRRSRGTRGVSEARGKVGEQERDYDADPIFVDALLDIGIESELLAEIKDIRDELNIIAMVLQHQSNVLPEMAENVVKELGSKKGSPEAWEIERKKREMLKVIDVHMKANAIIPNHPEDKH